MADFIAGEELVRKFVDKDIYDVCDHCVELAVQTQLSRDIKELIKAIRSLKCELDGE